LKLALVIFCILSPIVVRTDWHGNESFNDPTPNDWVNS